MFINALRWSLGLDEKPILSLNTLSSLGFSLYHFYRNQSGVVIIQRAGIASKEFPRNVSWFSGIAQQVDLW